MRIFSYMENLLKVKNMITLLDFYKNLYPFIIFNFYRYKPQTTTIGNIASDNCEQEMIQKMLCTNFLISFFIDYMSGFKMWDQFLQHHIHFNA